MGINVRFSWVHLLVSQNLKVEHLSSTENFGKNAAIWRTKLKNACSRRGIVPSFHHDGFGPAQEFYKQNSDLEI